MINSGMNNKKDIGVAKELVKGLAIGLPGLQAAAPGFDLQKK